ncbi:hypothetical protein [Streptomyces lavendofoliae]|uniref:hypothetical protein n=1 Tax=Streptomyces lavendofoliae TaxID=67314 RepID=UPI00300F6E52
MARLTLCCLDPLVSARRTLPPAHGGDGVLQARRLTLSGVAIDVVSRHGEQSLRFRAAAVRVEGAELMTPSVTGGATQTLLASRLVLSGPVEVRATEVEGVLFGTVPVVLRAPRLPLVNAPLWLPWVEMTDARIRGLQMRADSVVGKNVSLAVASGS